MPRIPAPKYTRDFYPEDMAVRRYVTDTWRQVSERAGFKEYDGPIFELSELYEIKSGEGILSELFSFEDRGGRRMALRPEMTPTLARMVNERINTLPRPIKWFSMPNCCRAERGQKGRLREFWQWNVDIIGGDTSQQQALADAECIAVAIDAMRAFGLGPQQVQVEVNHRGLLSLLLQRQGFESDAQKLAAFNLIDRLDKLPPEAQKAYAAEHGLSDQQYETVVRLTGANDREQLCRQAGVEADVPEASHTDAVLAYLRQMGVSEFVRFNPRIARGLAYYTGIVFEIFDAGGEHRAIAGGGRYDNLLGLLGGPPVSGVGFGMGDVVLGNLLEERGLLKDRVSICGPEFYVIDANPDGSDLPAALNVVQQLRHRGRSAEFSYKRTGVGKGLKAANACKARLAVIVSAEKLARSEVEIKNLATGEQRCLSVSELTSLPKLTGEIP